MNFEWDSRKAEANRAKHGVAFTEAQRFEFDAAYEYEDRDSHGELRIVAIGLIGDRVHVMVYTERGETIRVISLRRATSQEVRKYVDNL